MACRKLVTFTCLQQRASFSPQSALGHSLKRQLFSQPRGNFNKNNGGMWKRFVASKTVKAIPMEQTATRARWTGN